MLGAVALVLLFVLVQGLAFGVLTGAGVDLDVERRIGVKQALALTVVQLAGIVSVVLLVLGGASTWRRLGITGSEPGSFDQGWRLLMPVGILLVAPSFGYALFSDASVVHDGITPTSALVFTVLAVAIGLNEELWFRGLVVDRLRAARRPWLTVYAASLLFGLPHVANTSASWVNAAAVTLAVAIPFTIVRLRCDTLWPLVAWHAVIDAWAFVHTSSVVAEGDPTLPEAFGLLVVPAIVGAGYVIWFRRGQRGGLTP